MKIAGFVKFYNESINNNLDRCLKQLSKYTDYIVCCDDSSNDNSREIALKYTKDIITMPNDFKAELLHKQKLLKYLLKKYSDTDFIIHLDPDEILSDPSKVKDLCAKMIENKFNGLRIHLINLWLSEYWYRIDDKFNDLWKTIIWRNNGKLKYESIKQLHMPMHPSGIDKIGVVSSEVLQIYHYGFSTPELIARKYKTYQSLGQSGWNLERLKPTRKASLIPLYKGKKYSKPNKLSEKQWIKYLNNIIL